MINPVSHNNKITPAVNPAAKTVNSKTPAASSSFGELMANQSASGRMVQSTPLKTTTASVLPGSRAINVTPSPNVSAPGSTPTSASGSTSTSGTNPGTTAPTDSVANFLALFSPTNNVITPAPPTNPPTPAAPTPQSVFGDQVWMDSPSGAIGKTTWNYNPIYFATPQTAAKVAQMVGGTVVSMNSMTPNGPMMQSQPNLMVQLPNGKLVNPGLIADFYNHGYPQSYVDQMVQNEIKGA